MKLSKEEIEHLAQLARLELTDQEKNTYSQQLGEVLSYVSKVQKWIEGEKERQRKIRKEDKDGIEIIQLRDDREISCEISPPELLKNAPEIKDSFVKVPGILEEL